MYAVITSSLEMLNFIPNCIKLVACDVLEMEKKRVIFYHNFSLQWADYSNKYYNINLDMLKILRLQQTNKYLSTEILR